MTPLSGKALLLTSLLLLSVNNPHATSTSKIIGGQAIDIKDAPYQVVLLQDGYFLCGGCIIAPNVILTAAHCVNSPSYLTVRAGSSSHASGGSLHNTTAVHRHPDYDLYILDYDIALLFIDPLLELDETRQVIEISDVEPQEGENVTLSGWGTTDDTGEASSTLRAVTIPVVGRKPCQSIYSVVTVTPRMFCAGGTGQDRCSGDSGGPVVQNGKLVGTASKADGCAVEGIPGVNTNLANDELNQWIKNIINAAH